MKDTFGKKINLGTKVLYSTKGADYHIGEVIKLHPCKSVRNWADKVTIKVTKNSKQSIRQMVKFTNDPILYASNVVVLCRRLMR